MIHSFSTAILNYQRVCPSLFPYFPNDKTPSSSMLLDSRSVKLFLARRSSAFWQCRSARWSCLGLYFNLNMAKTSVVLCVYIYIYYPSNPRFLNCHVYVYVYIYIYMQHAYYIYIYSGYLPQLDTIAPFQMMYDDTYPCNMVMFHSYVKFKARKLLV